MSTSVVKELLTPGKKGNRMLQQLPTIELFDEPRLSKKQKRLLRKQQQTTQSPNAGLRLKKIYPLTQNQRKTFEAYDSENDLLLMGCAGTGKTFLSFYLSLEEVLEPNSPFKKIVVFRSVVPSREMGFLPGKAADKTKVYEAPYHGICAELFGRTDAYDVLKGRGLVQFESTSFIRGITLSDCIIIVDEFQNLNWMELKSVITRVGENCKIIYSGDVRQSDLYKNDKHDCLKFIKVVDEMNDFVKITFEVEDIVRSARVKSFIKAAYKLGFDA